MAGDRISFTLNGQTVVLTADRVRRALDGTPPGEVRRHGVVVDGVIYPVRQAFGLGTGLDGATFTSHTARRHLASLGFDLIGEVAHRDPVLGAEARPTQRPPADSGDPHAWPWEGAVQDVFMGALTAGGWTVTGWANTATKAPGVDVLAEKSGRSLGAEVKGWPRRGYADPRRAAEPKKTQPSTQAGHWYSQALMKAIMLLDSHPGAESLVVVPDYARYRDLAARTVTGRTAANVHVVFVSPDASMESVTWTL